MAVLFHCVLTCDVCGVSQSARAKLAPITAKSILEPDSSAPFILEYDPLAGKSWDVWGQKSTCSPECKAKLVGSG